MKTTYLKIFLVVTLCLFRLSAFAGDSAHGGGVGHTYFVSNVASLIEGLDNPSSKKLLDSLGLSIETIKASFDPSRVLVTTDSLKDDLGNAVDALVLKDDKGVRYIKINKKSWESFQEKKVDVKEIVTKELLRNAGYDNGNEAIEKAKKIVENINKSQVTRFVLAETETGWICHASVEVKKRLILNCPSNLSLQKDIPGLFGTFPYDASTDSYTTTVQDRNFSGDIKLNIIYDGSPELLLQASNWDGWQKSITLDQVIIQNCTTGAGEKYCTNDKYFLPTDQGYYLASNVNAIFFNLATNDVGASYTWVWDNNRRSYLERISDTPKPIQDFAGYHVGDLINTAEYSDSGFFGGILGHLILVTFDHRSYYLTTALVPRDGFFSEEIDLQTSCDNLSENQKNHYANILDAKVSKKCHAKYAQCVAYEWSGWIDTGTCKANEFYHGLISPN